MNLLPFLPWVPALPLLGSLLTFFIGPLLDRRSEALTGLSSPIPRLLSTAAIILSFFLAAGCCLNLLSLPSHSFELRGAPWIAGGEWGLLLDSVSAEMMLLISGIASLIHIYSFGYMSAERGLHRYYSGLNFFAASMQLLVLANNYLLLFAGWESVGVASYLLIGFHRDRARAGVAAMKAFVINRAADSAFLIALFLLTTKIGTTRFADVIAGAPSLSSDDMLLLGAMLLVGAVGKSAQFPLHIWLPDAMEGPTPVSALIHSATMVCAGVYLLVRSGFLFTHAPGLSLAIAIIGIASGFLAATVALVENDIKRVLAYSTISQIGFMFLALGVHAYQAALFHLFTHAFFKSLLFLGAGSLIHSLDGEQNLKHMGGLRKKMPVTFYTMLAASLALAALPPFAGFFSKDLILGEVHNSPYGGLLLTAGLGISLLTAAYVARMMFLAFVCPPQFDEPHPHHVPRSMALPMCLLAVGCVASGWIPSLIRFDAWWLMLLSIAVAVMGIVAAWYFYLVQPQSREEWDVKFSLPIRILRNRWYLDAIYEQKLLNGVVLRAAEGAEVIDSRIIDAGILSSARLSNLASNAFRFVDRNAIDGLVRFFSALVRGFSTPVRALQTGLVQTYALFFVAGLIAVLGYYLTR